MLKFIVLADYYCEGERVVKHFSVGPEDASTETEAITFVRDNCIPEEGHAPILTIARIEPAVKK